MRWEFEQHFPENQVPAWESFPDSTQVLQQKQPVTLQCDNISQRFGSMYHQDGSTHSICE